MCLNFLVSFPRHRNFPAVYRKNIRAQAGSEPSTMRFLTRFCTVTVCTFNPVSMGMCPFTASSKRRPRGKYKIIKMWLCVYVWSCVGVPVCPRIYRPRIYSPCIRFSGHTFLGQCVPWEMWGELVPSACVHNGSIASSPS